MRRRARRWLQPRLHRLEAARREVLEIRSGDPLAQMFASFGADSVIGYPPEHLGNASSVAIGNEVMIRSRVTFEALAPPGTVVIRLGDRVHCGYGARLVAVNGIDINDGCTIGHGVTLADTIHDYKNAVEGQHGHETALKLGRPLRLGTGCFVGNNCVIAGGITIGERSIIAPNTFINRDVPPRTIVAGNPARIQRYLRSDGTWEWLIDPAELELTLFDDDHSSG